MRTPKTSAGDWARALAVLFAAPMLFDKPATAGPIYNIVSLGTLGGTGSAAYAISETGQVVGQSRDASQTPSAFSHNGDGISSLGGGGESRASAVNDAGQIAGTGYVSGKAQAMVWSGNSGTNLGSLGGGEAHATGINNAGQVVGSSTNASGAGRAFVHSGGVMRDLGADWMGGWSSAYAINDQGQVVGYGELMPGVFRGFLWSGEGGMIALGTLGGWNSYATDINNSGQVAGHASVGSGYLHAFLYSDGVMQDLGTLGGHASYAYGINSAGDVVGYSRGSDAMARPFLYRNGVMLDLNNLLKPGSGWELLEAYDINDQGQIAGVGRYQGRTLAFRLDPVVEQTRLVHNPEPGTMSMMVLGGLLAGAAYWRRARAAGIVRGRPQGGLNRPSAIRGRSERA